MALALLASTLVSVRLARTGYSSTPSHYSGGTRKMSSLSFAAVMAVVCLSLAPVSMSYLMKTTSGSGVNSSTPPQFAGCRDGDCSEVPFKWATRREVGLGGVGNALFDSMSRSSFRGESFDFDLFVKNKGDRWEKTPPSHLVVLLGGVLRNATFQPMRSTSRLVPILLGLNASLRAAPAEGQLSRLPPVVSTYTTGLMRFSAPVEGHVSRLLDTICVLPWPHCRPQPHWTVLFVVHWPVTSMLLLGVWSALIVAAFALMHGYMFALLLRFRWYNWILVIYFSLFLIQGASAEEIVIPHIDIGTLVEHVPCHSGVHSLHKLSDSDVWFALLWTSLRYRAVSYYRAVLVAHLFVWFVWRMSTEKRHSSIVIQCLERDEEFYENPIWFRWLGELCQGRRYLIRHKYGQDSFFVQLIIYGELYTYKYYGRSRNCMEDAYLDMMRKIPDPLQIQGLPEFFGVRTGPHYRVLRCTLLFIYDMMVARNLSQKSVAVLRWLDELHTHSNALGYRLKLSALLGHLRSGSFLKGVLQLPGDDTLVVGALEDNVNRIDLLFKGIFNSTCISSLLKLVNFVWHVLFVFPTGRFDWDHLKKYESALTQSLPNGFFNVGGMIIENLSILIQCSVEFYRTGDLNVFLRNDNEVSKFLEKVEEIGLEVKSWPITPTVSTELTDLERRICDLIVAGEALRPRVKAISKGPFTSSLHLLRSMSIEVATMGRSCSNRPVPFSLLLCGPPKIGKSSLTSMIMNQFRVTNPLNAILNNGLSLPSNGVYTRTLGEAYWSMYMNHFWGIIFDDLGQKNPKVPDFALEINEIINVVNPTMFFPPMAGADEKGRRYVAPQIVLATSNNRDLNAHHACRSEAAVLRRFPFVIEPTVKQEFAGPGGSLDADKVALAGSPMDLWTFCIDKVELLDNGRGVRYERVATDLSTPHFLRWINDISLAHYHANLTSSSFTSKISKDAQCPSCKLLRSFCDCEIREVNSLEAYTSSFLRVFGSVLSGFLAVHTSIMAYTLLLIFFDAISNFCYRLGWRLARRVVAWEIAARINILRHRTTTLIYRHSRTIQLFMCVLTSSMLALYIYSLYKDVNVQGITEGKAPDPEPVNIRNEWKWNQPAAFSSFLSKESMTSSPESFDTRVRESVGVVTSDAHESDIKAFNVFGSFWLFPRHWVNTIRKKGVEVIQVTLKRPASRGGFGSFSGQIALQDFIFHDSEDFAIIRLSTPPGPDLLPYMTILPPSRVVEAHAYFVRDGVEKFVSPPVCNVSVPSESLSVLNGFQVQKVWRLLRYGAPCRAINGDCGSPLVLNEKGKNAIIGFHVASSPDGAMCYSCLPPVDWLQSIRSTNDCIVQGKLDLSRRDGSGMDYQLGEDVHDRCPIRYPGVADSPDGSSIIPIGQIRGVATHGFVSRVAANRFSPFWSALGYVTNKVRPKIGGEGGCASWLPKRNFILNATLHKDLMNPLILAKCAHHYLARLLFPSKALGRVTPLDEETNLHGSTGNNFITAMDFTTGAGFPYNKAKLHVLKKIPHERFPEGTYALTDEVRSQVDSAEETLSRGERPNFIFNSSLKDEPISSVKLEAGKIRVFQALPIHGLFLLRKYFLSVIAIFQTYNFLSEAAIGMDATGGDWDELHHYIFRPGWKVFCGDYSNYDQKMSSSIMMEAWKILIAIAIRSGNYCPTSVKIMFGLAVECCFCLVNFFGDLLQLNGTNPSGHSVTVVINSICNSLYIRYAWFVVFGNLDDFEANVRVMTYGDDNIVSVSPDFQERFNQVTVTAALASIGITYTDAAKSGSAAKPFCEPHEISFLKRSFVKREYGYAAPLEMASIHKMLLIGVHQNKVQENDRLASVLLSSTMEMFHHGREAFDAHLANAVKCAEEYDLKEWVAAKGGFPTYEQLSDRRKSKISRRVLLDAAGDI